MFFFSEWVSFWKEIVIGAELTQKSLERYGKHLHKHVFPPTNPSTVTAIVADGHAKVHARCGESYTHKGRPRASGIPKPYGHGWFMLVNPDDHRILAVSRMDQPEGNAIATDTLKRVLPNYPQCNAFVMDRCCALYSKNQGKPCFKQIKYWAVDHWHAHTHKKGCLCNPLHIRRLRLRLQKVNTSAAEQVFSWFRNYARILNECSVLRHSFKVLFFARLHNKACASRKLAYLNSHTRSKRGKATKKPYACTKKPSMK